MLLSLSRRGDNNIVTHFETFTMRPTLDPQEFPCDREDFPYHNPIFEFKEREKSSEENIQKTNHALTSHSEEAEVALVTREIGDQIIYASANGKHEVLRVVDIASEPEHKPAAKQYSKGNRPQKRGIRGIFSRFLRTNSTSHVDAESTERLVQVKTTDTMQMESIVEQKGQFPFIETDSRVVCVKPSHKKPKKPFYGVSSVNSVPHEATTSTNQKDVFDMQLSPNDGTRLSSTHLSSQRSGGNNLLTEKSQDGDRFTNHATAVDLLRFRKQVGSISSNDMDIRTSAHSKDFSLNASSIENPDPELASLGACLAPIESSIDDEMTRIDQLAETTDTETSVKNPRSVKSATSEPNAYLTPQQRLSEHQKAMAELISEVVNEQAATSKLENTTKVFACCTAPEATLSADDRDATRGHIGTSKHDIHTLQEARRNGTIRKVFNHDSCSATDAADPRDDAFNRVFSLDGKKVYYVVHDGKELSFDDNFERAQKMASRSHVESREDEMKSAALEEVIREGVDEGQLLSSKEVTREGVDGQLQQIDREVSDDVVEVPETKSRPVRVKTALGTKPCQRSGKGPKVVTHIDDAYGVFDSAFDALDCCGCCDHGVEECRSEVTEESFRSNGSDFFCY